MSQALFFIAALGAIAGACGVVMLRDAFFSVLALVAHLVSLAVLFLLLIAAAGAVVLAARRGGVREEEPGPGLAPLDMPRPAGTGTMAEAAGAVRRQ